MRIQPELHVFQLQLSAHWLVLFAPGVKNALFLFAGLAQERASTQNSSSELYATDSDIVEMPAQTLSTSVCFAVRAADFPS